MPSRRRRSRRNSRSGQVLTDVRDAYENLRTNDEIVTLYRSGYLDEAQQDRATSANTPISAAQRACLIFWMRSAVTGPTQLGYRQALASYLLAVEQLREAVGTRSLP